MNALINEMLYWIAELIVMDVFITKYFIHWYLDLSYGDRQQYKQTRAETRRIDTADRKLYL